MGKKINWTCVTLIDKDRLFMFYKPKLYQCVFSLDLLCTYFVSTLYQVFTYCVPSLYLLCTYLYPLSSVYPLCSYTLYLFCAYDRRSYLVLTYCVPSLYLLCTHFAVWTHCVVCTLPTDPTVYSLTLLCTFTLCTFVPILLCT